MKISPILADIGNTHIHIYDGNSVKHLDYKNAIKLYAKETIEYICVNQEVDKKIQKYTIWQNISSSIKLDGAYSTMGIDRQALCLSCSDGILVDAGSAITVDVMEGGVYKGGFILAGLKVTMQSYANISPILDITLQKDISIHKLPFSTNDGISYGVIAPIVAIIQKHQEDKKIYFTGGDGEFLSKFFTNAIFDDMLVFRGILSNCS